MLWQALLKEFNFTDFDWYFYHFHYLRFFAMKPIKEFCAAAFSISQIALSLHTSESTSISPNVVSTRSRLKKQEHDKSFLMITSFAPSTIDEMLTFAASVTLSISIRQQCRSNHRNRTRDCQKSSVFDPRG